MPTGKSKVAILLPLSGPNSLLGPSMLNAAQLAVFDAADNRFELMPRDTGADPSEAAREAVAAGAKLIIGPLFANHVAAVKPIAQAADISVLALSTDTALADQNVFVMGFAPAPQVERVVNYAHKNGLHNFAALIPEGAYGNLVAEAFRTAVERNGDNIISLEIYNPGHLDGLTAVKNLAAQRESIDALFLPAGGDDLVSIVGQLASVGFTPGKPRLIGTGLWDVADLGHKISFLDGGWFAAPDPNARRNFTTAYVKAYGSEPPRLVTLAYDATALAATLAKKGGRFDRTALTNPNGFAGVDGIFRLESAGLVERGLAVLEVTDVGGRVVDPAPVSFAVSP